MKAADRHARELERGRLALRLCAALPDTPEARRKVAGAVGVTERTVRRWAQRSRAGEPIVEPIVEPRGRRPEPVPRRRRQGLIAALVRLGPCAGVEVLRGLFRDVPYRTITKMKRRFSCALRRRRGWYRKRLHWLRAGAVWATDFTQPKARLPDADNRLCLVRDLGSGDQLEAAPCKGERARAVCGVLATLFLLFGPPLVLKHDGGGAFIADETQALLRAHDVVALRSPPGTPQYNGSCERSGGTLKQRIQHLAGVAGHPDRWTRADIEQARRTANTTARPRGANRPTPAEAFGRRRPVRPQERQAFQQTRTQEITRGLETHESIHGKMPTCPERAAIVRKATQRALCAHGYLKIRRGRISTPLSTWKADIKA